MSESAGDSHARGLCPWRTVQTRSPDEDRRGWSPTSAIGAACPPACDRATSPTSYRRRRLAVLGRGDAPRWKGRRDPRRQPLHRRQGSCAVLSHTGYQPPNGAAGKGRRSPDRGKWIPPGQVVVGCGLEKREAELQDGLYRRCDAGPAALPERGNRRRDVPPEIAYPAAGSIGRDAVNRLAARPLVEEVREVDAGSHRDLDGGGEPRVDLHEVRDAGGVPTELDFGVAFEVDFTHERFGVAPDVRGNGDALAQDRVPAQRRTGSLGPLGKARVHFAIRIQETHRFASSGKQWLEQRGLPEARHRRDGVTCLSGSDRELGTEPRSFPFVPQPRLAGLDHSRESDVLQCGCYISAVADDHPPRDPQPEAPRKRESLLLVDRDRQGRFGCERQAES